MKKWEIDGIERLLKAGEKGIHQLVKYNYKEVIRSLIGQLREKEREVARECAEIAENHECADACYCGSIVAEEIREKYGVDNVK